MNKYYLDVHLDIQTSYEYLIRILQDPQNKLYHIRFTLLRSGDGCFQHGLERVIHEGFHSPHCQLSTISIANVTVMSMFAEIAKALISSLNFVNLIYTNFFVSQLEKNEWKPLYDALTQEGNHIRELELPADRHFLPFVYGIPHQNCQVTRLSYVRVHNTQEDIQAMEKYIFPAILQRNMWIYEYNVMDVNPTPDPDVLYRKLSLWYKLRPFHDFCMNVPPLPRDILYVIRDMLS
jgi:hypothetical protein